MNFKCVILVLILILNKSLLGQCPNNDLHFRKQSQIDSFPLIYPNCTKLNGSLTIGSTTDLILTFQDNPTLIHDLKPLAQIKFVKDNLYLNRNPRLITLDGLQNIDTVGSLLIFENDSLMNIDDLNLKSVENIKLQKLSNLKSIQGLKSITNIGVLTLFKLPKLISLEGLNNLEKVQNLDFRHLFVTLNNLEKLRSVKGNLYIADCPYISNFLPLISFNDTIIGSLAVDQKGNMSMLGLESVKKLNHFQLNFDGVQSSSNLNIDVHGLQNVKIIGYFKGSGNLRPMVKLDTILEFTLVGVDTNKSYLLLNSLSVMGDLSIHNNPNLSNIDFLNKVKKITGIINIYNNPKLSICNIEVICDRLTKADSESEIHNNNLDCNTKEEIIQQCKDRPLFTTLSSHTWHEVIYDFIDNTNLEYTISLDKNQDGISKIKIENNTGHVSLTEEHLFEEGKRVYMGESINSRLMYDFNKNVSDTIFSSLWPTQLVVKEVGQFILENGEARKSMTLYCANDKEGSKYGYRHWVEGVGDLKGLYSIVHACTSDTSSKLICFYKDDERLYLTPEMFSCSLTTSNNEINKRYFIYPNPTSGFITTGPEFPLHYIEVYGMDGKLEYTSKGKQDQSSQDISALNNGVKVVKIYNKDNEIQFIKLLKIQ